ncbi:MAG: hypothetical protein ACFFG0_02520 [Candidatus Thorarchaeota archaeon]
MAIMKLQSNMVFWKILYGDSLIDITSILSPYVSSIRVKRSIKPPTKNSKNKHSPTEATIDITSLNYIEDYFLEGVALKIYIGYDPVKLIEVFSGRIKHLPDGSARDMLNYTVQAFGVETALCDEEKGRTFKLTRKSDIVIQIAMETGYNVNVGISDDKFIQGQFAPIQKQETDFQFLTRCAKKWNCVMWFDWPNTINFYDAEVAHYYDSTGRITIDPYILGYRTDKVDCNVETVTWKHKPSAAVSTTNPGIFGFNEFGKTSGKNEYKIANYDNKTWQLKPKYRNLYNKLSKGEGGLRELSILGRISQDLTLGFNSPENYNKFRKYYEVIKYNDNSRNDEYPPAGSGSGFEISVHLNEGEPSLTPPRIGLLYSGSINPRADSSFLPAWMNRSGLGEYAKLRINETILTYNNGMLKSELICTMGLPGE